MTMQATALGEQPRNLWRNTGAVLLGFFAVVVLSLGTDQVLHLLKVYPPWAQPMFEPRLNLLALSYRIVYSVMGSYIAARFAPRNPMRHALVLGIIGFILSVPGAIFITITQTWALRGIQFHWSSPLCHAPGLVAFCIRRSNDTRMRCQHRIIKQETSDAKNHSLSLV